MFGAMGNLLDVTGGDSDNDDLRVVKRYAQGCVDGDSPQRIHAVVSLLLLDLGASRARLGRAREQLEKRISSGQTGLWDEWADDLLERALDRLSVAGVETSDGETAYYEALHLELNPPTEPFRWDRTRRCRVPRARRASLRRCGRTPACPAVSRQASRSRTVPVRACRSDRSRPCTRTWCLPPRSLRTAARASCRVLLLHSMPSVR